MCVVKNKFDGRLTDWLTTGSAIENDVRHRLAAEGLGGALAHDPTHSINNIGLSATVGADYRAHIAREWDCRGVHKRLEARQLYGFEAHYGIRVPVEFSSIAKGRLATLKHNM